MKSTKTYIILFLALGTLSGAALAWRQYQELVELRAAAMNRDERADLMRRIWELEKSNRGLADQLAAGRTYQDFDDILTIAEEDPDENRDGRGSRGGRGGRGDWGGRGGPPIQQMTALRELMNKPEVQAMISLQQKAAIEASYGALFRNLNLSPEQAEQLKAALASRQATMQDVFTVAREQGINPRENPEAFQKLIASARDDVNNSIKSIIGEGGFAQLQNYEQTMPQRNLVNELQQRLSYTNTPLTSAQAEQLVQILAANTPQGSSATAPQPGGSRVLITSGGYSGPGGIAGGFSGGPGRGDFGMIGAALAGPGGAVIGGVIDGARGSSRTNAPITPTAVSQAQGVLAQPQLAALQQMQQQQQAQQQIQQLVRDTLTANQPQTSLGSGGSAASGSGAGSTGTAPTQSRRPRGGG